MATVLIVDDSAVDRRLVSGILEKVPGLKLDTACDGAEALEKIQRALPDIVVTDIPQHLRGRTIEEGEEHMNDPQT